ncbi:unnamed protein product [Didymodactylos carnosus]|uniref:Ubiquitin carboxyl-terminal hydrolase n=1 Tax=Didymodactylos carnosus TaxID=1234261 RepID=A0A814JAV0_9BILA|nr:unnamed protein product [Didymodactylos carnosus]CAF3807374.1 unnamed protein product [Didymodactylos carnosus]
MPENLDKACERYLCSRFASISNQLIGAEHKRHSILNQKLVFKKYTKNPLDKFRRLYTNTTNNKVKKEINMPSNNNVVLTSYNNTNSQQLSNRSSDIPISAQIPSSNYSPSKSSLSMSSLTSPAMDPLMEWKLLHERGSGLVNLGNTCFINASLQVLANCPPLAQWLINNSHFNGCRVKAEKQFCSFCEAERVIKLIHRNGTTTNNNTFSSQAVIPTLIARRIKDISTTFKQGRQEDASEFLICLLDKIVESCLRSSQPPERLLPSSGTHYDKLCHSQTILHDLFGLVLRSRVQCGRCHHTSDTYEVHYMWIVGVRNRYELQQSLQQFICKETLSGENLYRCIKCKTLVQATKRYTLHKTPKILLINLKRFEFGKNSHKLSHLVRYSEHLNIYPYLSEETQQTIKQQTSNYRLYAVLVHVGSSMHSGHYYAYVRSPNNLWYKADDTSMIKCQTNEVLNQYGAYILCYINETSSGTPQHNGNGATNGLKTPTSKLVIQSGKANGNTMPFFTPLQVPTQKIPKNG